MARLGYERFGAQGGDWGSAVTTGARQHDAGPPRGHPPRHAVVGPGPRPLGELTDAERAALAALDEQRRTGRRLLARAGHPAADASATALVDSPAAQCAWISRSSGRGPTTTGSRDRRQPRPDARQRDALLAARRPARRRRGCTGRASTRLLRRRWTRSTSRPGCSIFPKEICSARPAAGRASLHATSATGASRRAAATSPPSSSRRCSSPRREPRSARAALSDCRARGTDRSTRRFASRRPWSCPSTRGPTGTPGTRRRSRTSRWPSASGRPTRSSWGIWNVPETQVGALPDVDGKDVVELGLRDRVRVGVAGAARRAAGRRRRVREPARHRPRDAGQARARVPAASTRARRTCRCPTIAPTRDQRVRRVACGATRTPGSREAARLLRPGGRLVFLTNSLLVALCAPDDGRRPTDRLLRDQRGLQGRDVSRARASSSTSRTANGSPRSPATASRSSALHELYAPDDAQPTQVRVGDAGVGAPLAGRGDLGRATWRS